MYHSPGDLDEESNDSLPSESKINPNNQPNPIDLDQVELTSAEETKYNPDYVRRVTNKAMDNIRRRKENETVKNHQNWDEGVDRSQ